MGSLFNLKDTRQPSKTKNKALIKKAQARNVEEGTSNSQPKITGSSFADKLKYLEKVLGNLESNKQKELVRDAKTFHDRVTEAIKIGIGVYDVETDDKDAFKAKLVGITIYAKGMKSFYIPCGHMSYITLKPAKDQLTKELIGVEIKRMVDAGFKFIGHNMNYDVVVTCRNCGVFVPVHWDTYIAQRLLNENEDSNKLKDLHKKYVKKGEGDSNRFDELFGNQSFALIPIKLGYLYATDDGLKNWELYEFQKSFLEVGNAGCTQQGLEKVAWCFRNIEMKVQNYVIEMSLTGFTFDLEKSKEVEKTYLKKMTSIEEKIQGMIAEESFNIDQYNKKAMIRNAKVEKGKGMPILELPINIRSPLQVTALLYDVLCIIPYKGERKTGEEYLSNLDHPIAQLILSYREVEKIHSTFIVALQNWCLEDGKIHTTLNQVGADTLRFASRNPNLQNIPAKNKDIRPLFKASKGTILLSSDFSAQEPRLTAHMCKDEKMIAAYNEGKDLYVEIAAIANSTTYEECLEVKDGKAYPEGKKRRNQAKAIVLGVVYGKGIPAIAEDLSVPVERAKAIYNKIMKEFPALGTFIEDTKNLAYECGYVTSVWGQRRRLPDMQLPTYEFKLTGVSKNVDILNFDEDEECLELQDWEIDEMLEEFEAIDNIKQFQKRLAKKKEYIKNLKEDGIEVKENRGFISRAERQCVNARIQGSASQQTKLAIIRIRECERLNELSFKMLIPIHDELLAEVPIENAKEAAMLFQECMNSVADEYLDIPSKCDVAAYYSWEGKSVDI